MLSLISTAFILERFEYHGALEAVKSDILPLPEIVNIPSLFNSYVADGPQEPETIIVPSSVCSAIAYLYSSINVAIKRTFSKTDFIFLVIAFTPFL